MANLICLPLLIVILCSTLVSAKKTASRFDPTAAAPGVVVGRYLGKVTKVCVGGSQSGGPDVARDGDDSKKGRDDGVGYPTSSATNGTYMYIGSARLKRSRVCVKKPLLFVFSPSNGVFTASQWTNFPTKVQNASFVVPLSPSPLLSSDAVNLTVINQYYTSLAVDDITVPPNGAVSDVLAGSDIVTTEDPYGMLGAYIYTIPPPSTKSNRKGKGDDDDDDDDDDAPPVQAAIVVANDPTSEQWTVLYAVYRWTTTYGTCSTTSPCLLYSAFYATFVKPAVAAPKRRLLQSFIDAVKGAISGCKKCKYVSGRYVCVPC